MTLHEAELALNTALLVFAKTAVTWGIEAFAVWYFGRKAWRRLGLPALTRASAVKAFQMGRAVVMSRLPAAPVPAPVVRPDTAPVSAARDTTWRDVVRMAASLKTVDGAWYWSANEMAGWSKANRNETLAVVREVRGEPAEPYDPEKHLIVRGPDGQRVIAR